MMLRGGAGRNLVSHSRTGVNIGLHPVTILSAMFEELNGRVTVGFKIQCSGNGIVSVVALFKVKNIHDCRNKIYLIARIKPLHNSGNHSPENLEFKPAHSQVLCTIVHN